ncbi:MAG: domain S-box protein [Mucilaginibacter sp.]|uniref:PAS domain-containing protein n=1 Tax=Mucilaginibacter sp. TaxID=1882438 RepID=UPI0026176B92|nr:PAS domain S-box protein [Mucilaginibacter sp.]MDB5003450.1 domain S-box protein [Mucilaginibacter sp.]
MFSHTTIDLIDCVLAYDINKQKYLFIGPGIFQVLGITAKQLHQNHNLWDELINKTYLPCIKEHIKNLTPNNSIELNYLINTPQHTTKNIHDKKSLIIDDVTGHRVLLSVIREQPLLKGHSADTIEKLHQQEDAGLSKQLLNSLIDSQTNFLIRIDIDGNYSFINRQYLKVFGYKAKELLGKHFSKTTLPEEAHLCEGVFIKCLNNPGKVIPLLHKKPDIHGNLHDTEWEFISIVNENGEVCEIQGVGQDITDKIKIEAEIKSTAQKLDSFIESITDSFFILDNKWRFVRVNTAFEKVSEKNRDELLGQVIWKVFPSLMDTGFGRAYYDAKAKQESIKLMEYFAPLNKWFRTTVYPSAEGITVFAKNVTYEMRAQEEVLWTKNSLEALINNTTDQIWSVDAETRYAYMNNAYVKHIEQLTGVAPQKGEYSNRHMGYPRQLLDDWKVYYERALKGERYTIISESIDEQTKETVYYEINFNPIYTTSGQVMGAGCFARDISVRLKNEHELLSQNKRLRNIASLSSHELRRPVASMLGLIDIIDKENLQNPENRQIIDYLHIVSTEIDEVIRLIVDHTFTRTD